MGNWDDRTTQSLRRETRRAQSLLEVLKVLEGSKRYWREMGWIETSLDATNRNVFESRMANTSQIKYCASVSLR